MSEEVGTAMVLTIETAAGVGPGVVELKMGQRFFHAATHTPRHVRSVICGDGEETYQA